MSSAGLTGVNLPVSQIITAWMGRLTDVLYRKTGSRPAMRHTGAASPQPVATVWWQCSVAGGTISVLIGAADSSWRTLANLLGDPGVIAEDRGSRQAYLNVLGESFDASGIEINREPQSKNRETVEIRFPESEPIWLQVIAEQKGAQPQSAFDLLLDIELPITIRFGESQMLLQDLLAVQPNSTIEFDRRVNDPVEILVNGRTVARGEAVIVRGNYGVRIIEIADREDRLETSAASASKKRATKIKEFEQ